MRPPCYNLAVRSVAHARRTSERSSGETFRKSGNALEGVFTFVHTQVLLRSFAFPSNLWPSYNVNNLVAHFFDEFLRSIQSMPPNALFSTTTLVDRVLCLSHKHLTEKLKK
jgi:hypothetical protein